LAMILGSLLRDLVQPRATEEKLNA